MEAFLLKLLQVQIAFAQGGFITRDPSGAGPPPAGGYINPPGGGYINPPGGGHIIPPGGGNIAPLGGGRTGGAIVFASPLGGYGNFQEILERVINGLIILATPVVVIMVLWAAYQFMVSGGNPDKVIKARQTILWAAVGYGILLLARGITFIVQQLLTGY